MDRKTKESLNHLETKTTPGNLAVQKQAESEKNHKARPKDVTAARPITEIIEAVPS
ncbi:hypothetical protein [Geobacillus subterraneus]|uniref:hypothetical protein n=1 Tax=Geobacillus subterraneus TaxID=129338 RepID=UPI00160E0431